MKGHRKGCDGTQWGRDRDGPNLPCLGGPRCVLREAYELASGFTTLTWDHYVTGRYETSSGRSYAVQVNAKDVDSRWSEDQLRAYARALTEDHANKHGGIDDESWLFFVEAFHRAVKTAHRFIRGVEESARLAVEEGRKALTALEAGDDAAALDHARGAESLTSPYPKPGWREFRRKLEQAYT